MTLLVGKLYAQIVADNSDYKEKIKESEDLAKKWQVTVGATLQAISAATGAFLTKATLTAARTQVLGTSLNIVGKNAGYSTVELKRVEDKIKSLGITT